MRLWGTVSLLATAWLLAAGCEDPWKRPVREDVYPAEAIAMIGERSGDPDFVILDARTAAEFAVEHVRGAVNIDVWASDFEHQLQTLDRADTHLVYCRSGQRSLAATITMARLRFARVYNVLGGIAAIKREPGGRELVVER